MLANAAIVEAVAAAIEELDLPLVVVDPVLVSSSGDRLLDDDGVQRAVHRAAAARARRHAEHPGSGGAQRPPHRNRCDDAREAAERIHGMGAAAVIITGGHAADRARQATDVARRRRSAVRRPCSSSSSRVPRDRRRGTRMAPAAPSHRRLPPASRWACELPDAAARAQQYVAGAIRHALGIGHGRGPLDHFWQRVDPAKAGR